MFFGTSFQLATLCALVLPACFVVNFKVLITDPRIKREQEGLSPDVTSDAVEKKMDDESPQKSCDSDSSGSGGNGNDVELLLHPSSRNNSNASAYNSTDNNGSSNEGNVDLSAAASKMTFEQRAKATIALWPFMIPLFVVYFAEYAMQSGVWAAIGERNWIDYSILHDHNRFFYRLPC